ncbi:hypothetical protein [Pseudomonas sp.]|nr:hypothetical protein [Pseudomonas sp.]HUE93972.1 hypothetical protein [Pseudomonas sp.]
MSEDIVEAAVADQQQILPSQAAAQGLHATFAHRLLQARVDIAG